jgi:hypothetical protein
MSARHPLWRADTCPVPICPISICPVLIRPVSICPVSIRPALICPTRLSHPSHPSRMGQTRGHLRCTGGFSSAALAGFGFVPLRRCHHELPRRLGQTWGHLRCAGGFSSAALAGFEFVPLCWWRYHEAPHEQSFGTNSQPPMPDRLFLASLGALGSSLSHLSAGTNPGHRVDWDWDKLGATVAVRAVCLSRRAPAFGFVPLCWRHREPTPANPSHRESPRRAGRHTYRQLVTELEK